MSEKVKVLPIEAKARKNVPLYSGLIRYFPDALTAVAELSRIGNEQHNPGTPLHWDRAKSTDELDSLVRHLFEAGTTDTDTVLHSTKIAWRALANLQKEIEASRNSYVQTVALSQYDPRRDTALTKGDPGAYGSYRLTNEGMKK